MKKLMGLLLLLAAVAFACAGLGETARVSTPGGKANVRRQAEPKAKIAYTVPNHSLVEVEETADGWSKITYKKKSGWIKNEFLLLPSNLPGMTVYPDGETLILTDEPDTGSAIVGAVSPLQAVEVIDVQGGWCYVRFGDSVGWVKTENFSWQRAEAAGEGDWILQAGMFVGPAGAQDGLAEGDPVQVALIRDGQCLAGAAQSWRWLPTGSVCLAGVEDEVTDSLAGLRPIEASQKAQAALKKAFKAFEKENLYCLVGAGADFSGYAGPLYHCAFYNEQDRYAYGALVRPEDGRVVFTAAYDGFAVPRKIKDLLPEGQVELTLSTGTPRLGEVMDITVRAWTDHKCAWSVTGDNIKPYTGKPGSHFAAAYRPRAAGSYTLTVEVTDETGQSVRASADFTVAEGEAAPEALARTYSQKDGWWKNKTYRTSTLDKSGCAIFTLSHALTRMGFEGEDLQPERLAKRYSLCLTPDGTNNERLITEASRYFGFGTERDLFEDEEKITEALREGALFSFSIARGHIALIDGISDDGTMVHIVDSAPTATFERIVNTSVYYPTRGGTFRAALSPDDIDGARWYFDQDAYGGLEYWMTVEYAARRGVRLIKPGADADE